MSIGKVEFLETLGGVKIPMVMAVGSIRIPLLTRNSPVSHFQSYNWKTFHEHVQDYRIDHPHLDDSLVVLAVLGKCESTFIKKPRVRSLNWINKSLC